MAEEKKDWGEKGDEIAAKFLEAYAKIDTTSPSEKSKAELEVFFEEKDVPMITIQEFSTVMMHHLINMVYGQTKLKNGELEAGIEEMRREMGYGKSSIIEKLLIDEIVLELFQMRNMQALLTGYLTRKGSQAKHVRFADQMVDSAQRRFIKSINALARLRKADISMQINIAADGGQQVNIKK